MYVKITNDAVDQFPYTVGNLRRDNPNTSFPKRPTDELLASWDVYPVTTENEPEYNEKTDNIALANAPVLSDGTWVLSWSTAAKSSDEIEEYNNNISNINRNMRNGQIAETDWWASSDLTMTAEQTAYRQALRDITSHANWPDLNDDDWPTKP
tara:strand:- start:57 stop:515 length:459 start_codon:yes stop_codon:yes gene_type:complete